MASVRDGGVAVDKYAHVFVVAGRVGDVDDLAHQIRGRERPHAPRMPMAVFPVKSAHQKTYRRVTLQIDCGFAQYNICEQKNPWHDIFKGE